MVALAFLLAYEVFVAKDRVRTRTLALTPALLTVAAWQLLYNQLGYGAQGSGEYISPVGEPLAFLAALPMRYATLLVLSLSTPFIPGGPSAWFVTGVGVGLALLGFLLSPRSKSGAARFGFAATAIACSPLAASVPIDRLLVLASFGLALATAELQRRVAVASVFRTVAAIWVVVVHVVVPTGAGLYVSGRLDQVLALHTDAYGAELPDAGLNRRGLVVVHTPNYPATDNLGSNRVVRGLTAPNVTWILHAEPNEPEEVCVDPQTIELREPTAGWPVDGFSAQFRNTVSKPFAVGDVVRTLDYVATITEVDDGRATAVRFRFRAKLEHPSFLRATWRAGDFVPTSTALECDQ